MPDKRPREDWLSNDLVTKHLYKATEVVALRAADNFLGLYRYMLGHSRRDSARDLNPAWPESPLEVIWDIWWGVGAKFELHGELFYLESQQTIVCGTDTYRLDFVVQLADEEVPLLADAGITWPLIGIEVDGHAFHEKTLEQVAYRNRRDRQLQQLGWKVFHFSFSEVTTDPIECVRSVLSYARTVRASVMCDARAALETPEERERLAALVASHT